jgi:hypothetical protein
VLTRLNLHASPKPNDFVNVKVQIMRVGGWLDTVGTLHVHSGEFPKILRALKTEYDVTSSGRIS